MFKGEGTGPAAVLVILTWSTAVYAQPQIDFASAHQDKKVTAVYVEEATITVDGALDESEWGLAQPATDFIQWEPLLGRPATERTEVRVLYDRNNVYIGADCFDSAGQEGIVVDDLTRDFFSLDTDFFQVILDTFDDDRNGMAFSTNPMGAIRDLQIAADGTSTNRDWDTVWHIKARITDQGWQAEFAIPFKTLRFNDRQEKQVWGINFERRIRRKNETAFWSPVPRPYRAYRVSLAGTLDGISDVKQGRNLYLKPYVSAPTVRREEDDVDFEPDAGLDVRWKLTSSRSTSPASAFSFPKNANSFLRTRPSSNLGESAVGEEVEEAAGAQFATDGAGTS